MKYSLCLILLVLLLLSCKEKEEVIPEKLLLTKAITSTKDQNPYGSFTYTFTYNNKGLLLETKEEGSKWKHNQNTFHKYDSNMNLVEFKNIDNLIHTTTTHSVTYDNIGRLSSLIITSKYEPQGAPSPYYYTFVYNQKGQISQIKEGSSADKTRYVYFLEYDAAGNIIKEIRNTVLPSGRMIQSEGYLAYTYDNKHNPFYKLGSPLYIYGSIQQPIQPYIVALSPNNIVLAEGYEKSGSPPAMHVSYSYEYNDQGYPTLIEFGRVEQRYEYSSSQ